MHLTWITLLTFAATTLLVFSVIAIVYDVFFRYRITVRERVSEIAGDSVSDHAVSLFKEFKQQPEMNFAAWQLRLQHLIDQSGVRTNISAVLTWISVVSVGLGCFGAYYSFWLGLTFAITGGLLPLGVLRFCSNARQRKLSSQLPEAFAMISRAVRAGQTVPAAMQIIAEDFEVPISTEFALCCEQQNLGISRESALRKLAVRSGIMDLQMFVVALLVQGKSGGDLAEMLDNLSLTIRKRLKLKDRVRALTGEGRMQALVLMLLPMAALVGIMFMSPEYAQELLDRPWLLGITASAQVVGALWIRKIVDFEY